jgi:hypothetical protein
MGTHAKVPEGLSHMALLPPPAHSFKRRWSHSALRLGMCLAALPGHANPTDPAACAALGHAAPQTAARVAVWVDLSMPEPAPGAAAAAPSATDPTTRAAALSMRQAVQAQQQAVAARLRALGGTELAQIVLVRNAIAVNLPADALACVRQWPGVLRVRPVTHRNRVDAPPVDAVKP